MLDLTKPLVYCIKGEEYPTLLTQLKHRINGKDYNSGIYIKDDNTLFVNFTDKGYPVDQYGKKAHVQRVKNVISNKELEEENALLRVQNTILERRLSRVAKEYQEKSKEFLDTLNRQDKKIENLEIELSAKGDLLAEVENEYYNLRRVIISFEAWGFKHPISLAVKALKGNLIIGTTEWGWK